MAKTKTDPMERIAAALEGLAWTDFGEAPSDARTRGLLTIAKAIHGQPVGDDGIPGVGMSDGLFAIAKQLGRIADALESEQGPSA